MPTQRKDERWPPTFETAEELFFKEMNTGSKTGKIEEPATDGNRTRTDTHDDDIRGSDILQDV